ncbi:hypothetical protein G7Y89_g1124 [Cudoniella acicularis]|uniref:Uncharacterized protein n=1 Tax=Cudoniella acicularis TaxID=354080 RepID=A0A8H4RWX2_9HELO|nr:hypothetical protein G7Y89_g1124 [Cudoniella acicularis]
MHKITRYISHKADDDFLHSDAQSHHAVNGRENVRVLGCCWSGLGRSAKAFSSQQPAARIETGPETDGLRGAGGRRIEEDTGQFGYSAGVPVGTPSWSIEESLKSVKSRSSSSSSRQMIDDDDAGREQPLEWGVSPHIHHGDWCEDEEEVVMEGRGSEVTRSNRNSNRLALVPTAPHPPHRTHRCPQHLLRTREPSPSHQANLPPTNLLILLLLLYHHPSSFSGVRSTPRTSPPFLLLWSEINSSNLTTSSSLRSNLLLLSLVVASPFARQSTLDSGNCRFPCLFHDPATDNNTWATSRSSDSQSRIHTVRYVNGFRFCTFHHTQSPSYAKAERPRIISATCFGRHREVKPGKLDKHSREPGEMSTHIVCTHHYHPPLRDSNSTFLQHFERRTLLPPLQSEGCIGFALAVSATSAGILADFSTRSLESPDSENNSLRRMVGSF